MSGSDDTATKAPNMNSHTGGNASLSWRHAKRGQIRRFVNVTAVLYVDSTNKTQNFPWDHGEAFAVTNLEVTNIKCQSSLNCTICLLQL
jgi:hypothetical protein